MLDAPMSTRERQLVRRLRERDEGAFRELVGEHINVNVIAPGRFPSKMTKHIAQDEAAMAEDVSVIPMKRWGREEEMAALAISLASTAGAYMTGAIIPIDGGFHL